MRELSHQPRCAGPLHQSGTEVFKCPPELRWEGDTLSLCCLAVFCVHCIRVFCLYPFPQRDRRPEGVSGCEQRR